MIENSLIFTIYILFFGLLAITIIAVTLIIVLTLVMCNSK